MAPVPAICDYCGTLFYSSSVIGGSGSAVIEFKNVKLGPCPVCGRRGSVPDGLYEFVGETLRTVTTWTPDRQLHFAQKLRAAQRAADPRRAAVEAIRTEPEIYEIAKRLLIPRTAADFYAFLAVLIAILALVTKGGDDVTINQEFVIERVVQEQKPTVPPSQRSEP